MIRKMCQVEEGIQSTGCWYVDGYMCLISTTIGSFYVKFGLLSYILLSVVVAICEFDPT